MRGCPASSESSARRGSAGRARRRRAGRSRPGRTRRVPTGSTARKGDVPAPQPGQIATANSPGVALAAIERSDRRGRQQRAADRTVAHRRWTLRFAAATTPRRKRSPSVAGALGRSHAAPGSATSARAARGRTRARHGGDRGDGRSAARRERLCAAARIGSPHATRSCWRCSSTRSSGSGYGLRARRPEGTARSASSVARRAMTAARYDVRERVPRMVPEMRVVRQLRRRGDPAQLRRQVGAVQGVRQAAARRIPIRGLTSGSVQFGDEPAFADFLRGRRWVLDAGTGSGLCAERCARLHPAGRAVGMNLSDGVTDARRHFPHANLDYVQGDI